MITDYKILSASSINDMEKKVMHQIVRGWQPLGGIQVSDMMGMQIYQAMVKYAEQ